MKTDKSLEELKQEARALESMPESRIDTDNIPEVFNFDTADRGRFYRPVKKPVTLRLDADLIEWFKRHHPKYQSAINKALREYVKAQL